MIELSDDEREAAGKQLEGKEYRGGEGLREYDYYALREVGNPVLLDLYKQIFHNLL
jgi:hypothetical protein